MKDTNLEQELREHDSTILWTYNGNDHMPGIGEDIIEFLQQRDQIHQKHREELERSREIIVRGMEKMRGEVWSTHGRDCKVGYEDGRRECGIVSDDPLHCIYCEVHRYDLKTLDAVQALLSKTPKSG